MNRKNGILLLIIWALCLALMLSLHWIFFADSPGFGLTGAGLVGIGLLFLNRTWLHPSAPPMTKPAITRSVIAAVVGSVAMSVLFGFLGA